MLSNILRNSVKIIKWMYIIVPILVIIASVILVINDSEYYLHTKDQTLPSDDGGFLGFLSVILIPIYFFLPVIIFHYLGKFINLIQDSKSSLRELLSLQKKIFILLGLTLAYNTFSIIRFEMPNEVELYLLIEYSRNVQTYFLPFLEGIMPMVIGLIVWQSVYVFKSKSV